MLSEIVILLPADIVFLFIFKFLYSKVESVENNKWKRQMVLFVLRTVSFTKTEKHLTIYIQRMCYLMV